ALLRGRDGELQAIVLKGIDPATVAEATQVVETIRAGSLADLEPDPDGDEIARLPGLIVGSEIANRFLLRIGDPLVLISPMGGQPTPLGPAPRLERFRVAGIFRSDFFQFDEGFVYASLAGAQKFMKLGDVAQGVEVRTEDAYRSRQTAIDVERALGDGGVYYTRDWKDYFPGFFQALKTERVMMFVLLSFIMVVAGFIIVATLIMMIMEKSQDIAILKTMGCADDAILRVFAIEGFLIGIVGLVLGIGMGLVITKNLDVIQSIVERTFGFDVLPAKIYQLQSLPHAIEPAQLALISLIAMVLSIGATLLPSWQASRLDPAEALRYE
ncbi:MAG: FtsX-like permease family protein, partial [Steroidobacteraceae bacterium]